MSEHAIGLLTWEDRRYGPALRVRDERAGIGLTLSRIAAQLVETWSSLPVGGLAKM
jgi:hypothetical protein